MSICFCFTVFVSVFRVLVASAGKLYDARAEKCWPTRQRSEISSQKSEVGSQRSEVRVRFVPAQLQRYLKTYKFSCIDDSLAQKVERKAARNASMRRPRAQPAPRGCGY